MSERTYDPELVAARIHEALEAAVRRRGQAALAIPGGRSPGAVLTRLAAAMDAAVRERLHLFWVDERCVPPDHPDRNDLGTLAAWDTGGPRPAAVHSMPAEDPDLAAAAGRYAQTIASATAGGSFDVCLLGIGADGHVASLFPNHPGLDETLPVFAVADSPKPPPVRLTVSLDVLNRAGQRFVLALGPDKQTIARRCQDSRDRALPASLLAKSATTWYVDAAGE